MDMENVGKGLLKLYAVPVGVALVVGFLLGLLL